MATLQVEVGGAQARHLADTQPRVEYEREDRVRAGAPLGANVTGGKDPADLLLAEHVHDTRRDLVVCEPLEPARLRVALAMQPVEERLERPDAVLDASRRDQIVRGRGVVGASHFRRCCRWAM